MVWEDTVVERQSLMGISELGGRVIKGPIAGLGRW